jgi:hypothetical protein
MTNWNDLSRETQELILRPICHEILDDFNQYSPTDSKIERVRFPPPLVAYHNLILSSKSVAKILAELKVSYGRSLARLLKEAQSEKLEHCWRCCIRKKDCVATRIATDGMSYLERLMARVGRFWKSPDFFEWYELGEEMLGELPPCIKVELITVMQEWIQKNTHDRSVWCRSGEDYRTDFSVRGDSGRFIFWTGRFEMEGERFVLESVDSYSFT